MTAETPSLGGSAVVVTGVGGRGQVGAAVAMAFAQQGAIVHCIGRGSDVAERVHEIETAGLHARSYAADLTDFELTAQSARSIAQQHSGQIVAVAAIAGGFKASGPIAESDPSVFANQIAINLTTAFSTARAFAPHVRAARGVFVFVAAAAVLPGGKTAGLSAYAAAKGGLVQLVRALAEEERQHGVRVYGVAPTAIRTATNVAAMGEDIRYVEREDFAATLVAMCAPSFAVGTGEILRLA